MKIYLPVIILTMAEVWCLFNLLYLIEKSKLDRKKRFKRKIILAILMILILLTLFII